MTSSKSNYLPKAPPPGTIALEVRASGYEFLEDTNIQSIAYWNSFWPYIITCWKERGSGGDGAGEHYGFFCVLSLKKNSKPNHQD